MRKRRPRASSTADHRVQTALRDLLQETSGIAARTNQILDPASNSRPEGLVSCGPASSHASDTSRTPVRLAFSPSQVTTSRPNFPIAAIAEAEAAPAASLAGRSDLRDLALVTIDGTDARDFDDAVWAEADPHPRIATGGISSWRSPMWPGMCAPARPSIAKRDGAATRSTFPTVW